MHKPHLTCIHTKTSWNQNRIHRDIASPPLGHYCSANSSGNRSYLRNTTWSHYHTSCHSSLRFPFYSGTQLYQTIDQRHNFFPPPPLYPSKLHTNYTRQEFSLNPRPLDCNRNHTLDHPVFGADKTLNQHQSKILGNSPLRKAFLRGNNSRWYMNRACLAQSQSADHHKVIREVRCQMSKGQMYRG